jgi:hypothetical protein
MALQATAWHGTARHGMALPSILRREFFARGVSTKKCHKIPANKGSVSPVLAVYLATCLATYVFLGSGFTALMLLHL